MASFSVFFSTPTGISSKPRVTLQPTTTSPINFREAAAGDALGVDLRRRKQSKVASWRDLTPPDTPPRLPWLRTHPRPLFRGLKRSGRATPMQPDARGVWMEILTERIGEKCDVFGENMDSGSKKLVAK